MRKVRLKKQKRKIDGKIFWSSIVLTLLGVVVVADASAPQALSYFSDRFYFAKEQAVAAGVGIVVLIVLSQINYKLWERLGTALFAISVLLLLLVFIPTLGVSALGAKRWILLGGNSLQPSEIVKLAIAIYLAKVAAKDMPPLSYFLPLALVSFLIMLQPDLGTTLVIAGIGLTQIYLSGINIVHFLGAISVAGLTSFILIITSSYRKDRLLTFLETTRDPLGKSYHIRQVLLALGTGGLFGVGLGQSRQKYLFLPEAATDSVFAVIAEELGFVGAIVLIGFFVWFILRILKLAKNAPDKFSKIYSFGVAAWIGGQAFLNMGSMVSLVPLTGLPLPFISYGGTSLVTILSAVGILLNISKHARK